MENQDRISTGLRVFLSLVVGFLFLLTVFTGWIVAGLMVADFSGMGNDGPIGLDEMLVGVFPMALLVGPWVTYLLFTRWGEGVATAAALVSPVVITLGWIAMTIIRVGRMSEDVEIVVVIAGIWAFLGIIWFFSIRPLVRVEAVQQR